MGKPLRHQINLRIHEDTMQALRRVAAYDGVSLTQVLERMIVGYAVQRTDVFAATSLADLQRQLRADRPLLSPAPVDIPTAQP